MMHTFTCTEIRAILKEMAGTSLQPVDREPYFRNKFPSFTEQYPRLFLCAIDPQFPLFDGEFLKNMMEMQTKLSNESVSVDEADKEIYDELRLKYVDPVLETLNSS